MKTNAQAQDSKTARRVMKRLVLIIQRKGSVGKTTIAGAYIDWVRSLPEGWRVGVFDPDQENRTLSKIYGPDGSGPLPAPHFLRAIDWRGDSGSVVLDDLVNCLAPDGPADLAVLDGVANQSEDVLTWLSDIRLFDQAKRHGFGVTVIVPVDETQDSSDGATRVVTTIKSRTDVVMVHSHKVRARLPWESAIEQAIAQGAEIDRLYRIDVERFAADVESYMKGTGIGLPHTLWQAMHQDRNSMMKARAETYWERLLPQFERLAPVLLPTVIQPTGAKA